MYRAPFQLRTIIGLPHFSHAVPVSSGGTISTFPSGVWRKSAVLRQAGYVRQARNRPARPNRITISAPQAEHGIPVAISSSLTVGIAIFARSSSSENGW